MPNKDNINTWHAMFIYDNPVRVHSDRQDGSLKHGHSYVDGNGIKMPVGAWYTKDNKGYLTSIALNGKGQAIDRRVDVPFVSNWIDLGISENGDIYAKQKVEMIPQGVLLKIEISNSSSFPVRIDSLAFETNVMHPNIEYELTMEQLPPTTERGANAKLKWRGTVGDKIMNSRGQMVTINSEDRVLLGQTFVGGISYKRNKDLNEIILGKDGNRSNGSKLDAYFYVWGMPKTQQEIQQIKNSNNIPMTAFYTSPIVVEEARIDQRFTVSNDGDFDEKILEGYEPAPTMGANLSFASQNTICGKNSKIIPIRIAVRNRKPTPIEYMCQHYTLKNETKQDTKPHFAKENDRTNYYDEIARIKGKKGLGLSKTKRYYYDNNTLLIIT